MTYKTYVLSIWEVVLTGFAAMAVTGMIAFLFYRSLWGMVALPVVFVFLKKVVGTTNRGAQSVRKREYPPISSETLREPLLLNEQTTAPVAANLATRRALEERKSCFA